MFGVLQQLSIISVAYVYTGLYLKCRLQPETKIPSLLNAIVCSAGSVSCYLFPCTIDLFIVLFYGYIYWDLVHNIIEYKQLRDTSGIIHHWLFIVALLVAPRDDCVLETVWWLLSGEISTVFLQIRNMLRSKKLTNGKLYKDVSKMFVVTFIPTRVFLFGWGLIDTWINCYRVAFFALCLPYTLNLVWALYIIKRVVAYRVDDE
jgi:hypothetical protein